MLPVRTAPHLRYVYRCTAFVGIWLVQRANSTKSTYINKSVNDSAEQAKNFFQYSWGSWLTNNTVERAKRETMFSIDGIFKLVKDLKVDGSQISKPQQANFGVVSLNHNWTEGIIGVNNYEVKTMTSVHEGKHHRVYKIALVNGRDLCLRIPYKLESDFAIEQCIKSEVATLDFLDLKLGLNVPKVICYGATKSNLLNVPFILQEFVEGELLMKKWHPLAPASETVDQELKEIISPILEFQVKALDVTFTMFGSLYFFDDVSHQCQQIAPYDGETDTNLVNRWRVGPSVEKQFFRGKQHLAVQTINGFNGPWDSQKPLDVITDLAKIQSESLRQRLALAQADASNKVEDIDGLKRQIETFERLLAISQRLLNPASPSIMNSEEIFRPRMYFPDLDPMNVIVQKDTGKKYFVDLEHTSIKPFILFKYPDFVAYPGPKVYNLEEDIPGYAEMEELEKQQYRFMYYKTRNERLWEHALNAKRHDFIAIASPHIKVLRAPYLQALSCKSDKDFLFVENAIVQLQAMWNVYVANALVNAKETAFPIAYTQEALDQHQRELDEYQRHISSTPFALTGGWVPQDLFELYQLKGLIVNEGNGNYRLDEDAVLKDAPKDALALM